MTLAGSALNGVSGRRYTVGPRLSEGGQGVIHRATDTSSGRAGVVKIFRPELSGPAIRERTRYLVSVSDRLYRECPVLCLPADAIERPRGCLGYFSPLADGETWESFLAAADFTFLQGIQAGVAVAHGVDVLERNGIAHGDLQSGNLMVERSGTAIRVRLIDFDNFVTRGLPPPPHLGQIMYLAPELREPGAGGRTSVPDVRSDRYALTVLLHEMVLLVHPASGADDTAEEFREAMCLGRWRFDPVVPRVSGVKVGGYPSKVLNSELARLFRAGMSLDPGKRPEAARWKEAFLHAIRLIHVCEKCGGPDLVEEGKVRCPVCNKAYPVLSVETSRGRRFRLDIGSTVIGRDDLGGAPAVSERHAVFIRRGPETWLEPVGRNGTRRWNGHGWIRLRDGLRVLVQSGDRIKMADVEVTVTA